MSEEFLQYIWKHQLYTNKKYVSNTGDQVELIHPGDQNTNAGPDFSNARVRIANTLWAGNCEVHVSSSDWTKHAHNLDPSYKNIILHIVKKNDVEIRNSDKILIPTIELEYPVVLEEKYKDLLKSELWIPCAKEISNVQSFQLYQWLTTLSVERLEKHSTEILSLLTACNNHWEEAFYVTLAKSFGFNVNSLPFQLLAKSLPLIILAKHKENLFQLEALLFGQSGLITNPVDNYSQLLFDEYKFLQKKYGLKPIDRHLWKFLRLRPSNFPTVRIAQFAA